MDPIWYSIRIIVTGIMTGIGGLLLWAAYMVAPNVNGAAIAWMVLLGLAIPAGFFALFTLAGWQRTIATNAAPLARPGPFIAWCGDPRRYAVLWIGFVALLFGGARMIVVEIQRGDVERADLQAYHRAVRDTLFDACWNRAGQAFREETATGDLVLRPRMMHYCTCLDIEVERSYTPEQFAAVAKERWWGSGDDKIDRIMQKCRLEDSSLVRAAQTIRKSGGNPESDAMQPKLLAYTACVKIELESGYTPATLMQVSADRAWQDRDGKFRQIIDRCTKYAEF
jgi:hypothetical protein